MHAMRRHLGSLNRCLAIVLATVAVTGLAAPADFDPAFGEGGVVILPHSGSSRVIQLAKATGGMFALVESTDAPAVRWLHRVDDDGRATMSFNGGLPVSLERAGCAGSAGACSFSRVAVAPGGKVAAAGFLVEGATRRVAVARWNAAGIADATFGTAGAALAFGDEDWQEELVAVAAGDNGSLWVVTAAMQISGEAFGPVVYRFRSDGTPDDAFGENGRRVVNAPVIAGAAVLRPDDRLMIAGSGYHRNGEMVAVLLRLTAQAEVDGSYGRNGFYVSDYTPVVGIGSLEMLADGTAMMAGFTASVVGQFGMAWWIEADGSSEVFHFGASGLGLAPTTAGARHLTVATVSDRQQGLLQIGASFIEPFGLEGRTFAQAVVHRRTPTQALDYAFAPFSRAPVWREFGMVPAAGAFVAAGGQIVLGASVEHAPRRDAGGTAWVPVSSPAIVRLRGGDLPAPVPFTMLDVVEYVHRTSGHFFVTHYPHEIAALDSLAPNVFEWTRTGRGFAVYRYGPVETGTGTLAPVCRFFSGATFAPLFSHFYTPYPKECQSLTGQGSGWTFEAKVFALGLPEGTLGARTCSGDRIPLYRAYNNRLSGAPNHRYTSDPAVLDQMVAAGWTFEGEAATRVFACLPAPLP